MFSCQFKIYFFIYKRKTRLLAFIDTLWECNKVTLILLVLVNKLPHVYYARHFIAKQKKQKIGANKYTKCPSYILPFPDLISRARKGKRKVKEFSFSSIIRFFISDCICRKTSQIVTSLPMYINMTSSIAEINLKIPYYFFDVSFLCLSLLFCSISIQK